jgi:hypothetical protein
MFTMIYARLKFAKNTIYCIRILIFSTINNKVFDCGRSRLMKVLHNTLTEWGGEGGGGGFYFWSVV